MFDSLRPHGLYPSGLLCPWNSPDKDTGAGCHSLSIRSSWPREQTWFSHIASIFFMVWAIREPLFLMAEYYSTVQRCYWVQALTACCITGQQIKKQVVGASNSDFIWKASKLRRWWASVPKNHLPWVKIQVYFDTERGGGVVGCCKLLDVKNPLFSQLSG